MPELNFENPKQSSTQEQSPKEREPQHLNFYLFGKNEPSLQALRQVLTLLGNFQVKIITVQKELQENLEQSLVDVLFFMQNNEAAIKQITMIRNNPQITRQPVIICAKNIGEPELAVKQSVYAGADIGITNNVTTLVVDLLRHMASIPELIMHIEDNYGDKMLINKQNFYRKFQDKLNERSEVTADLPQELTILEKLFKQHSVKSVLDGGGGEGRIAIPLAEKGYDVTNVDSAPELLQAMRSQNPNIKAIEADLKNLPLPDNNFDAVTYNWHVFCDILGAKAKKKMLAEAHRVLKKDGLVILDVPDRSLYEIVEQVLLQTKPELLYNFEKTKQEKEALEKLYQELTDPNAKYMILQGINALNYVLDLALHFEPHPDLLQGQQTLPQQFEFKKDGVYLSHLGQDIFIGYVPSALEIKEYLKAAGFEDIKVIHWKTKSGFLKASFTGIKK